MNEDLYRNAMKGIRQKVAMQEIRRVIRTDKADCEKLAAILDIIHAYEEDLEVAYREDERRAIEADEAEMRREKVNEMFEDMAAPLDKLMDCVKGERK